MKVKFGMSWEKDKREHDLASLLSPEEWFEDSESRARKTAECFGRLMAYLVEQKIVPLKVAVDDILQLYGEVEE